MNPAVTPDCDYVWVGFANPAGAATGNCFGFEGSPSEIKRRRWVLCGGGRPCVALVVRDELDQAGKPVVKQSVELKPGTPRTPWKDGEIAQIVKGKALPAVGQ